VREVAPGVVDVDLTSTLLREVLLIWMSCSLASKPLNCVPS
jgi:hypothetical protein